MRWPPADCGTPRRRRDNRYLQRDRSRCGGGGRACRCRATPVVISMPSRIRGARHAARRGAQSPLPRQLYFEAACIACVIPAWTELHAERSDDCVSAAICPRSKDLPPATPVAPRAGELEGGGGMAGDGPIRVSSARNDAELCTCAADRASSARGLHCHAIPARSRRDLGAI